MEQQSTDPIQYPRAVTLLAATCAVLFIIIGVVGNLITIVALLRSRTLKAHATTWFILSLCVSDLLFCIINLPISSIRYFYEEWILGDTLCRLFPFFFYGNVATSLMSLVAITINRYVLISHYSSYDRIYRRNWIAVMIAFVWMFSFSMLVPPMLEVWGTFGLNKSTFSCTILKKDGKSPKKFLFAFGILLPCLVIIFCYSRIFIEVRRSRQRITDHGNGSNTHDDGVTEAEVLRNGKNARKSDMRLTKMMLLIFCCFLVCFLPLLVFNVVDDSVTVPALHVLASILAWASSVINPFIYAFSNSQYRKAYSDLFHGSKNGQMSRSISGGRSFNGFLTEMVQVNNKLEKEKLNAYKSQSYDP